MIGPHARLWMRFCLAAAIALASTAAVLAQPARVAPRAASASPASSASPAAPASPTAPAAAPRPSFDAVRTLTIGQGAGTPPDLTVYVDLVDERGEPPDAVPASAIAASIGARAAEVRGVRRFSDGVEAVVEGVADGTEGVAYIFLVDVSQSLSAAEMARVREAISLWGAALGPRDRAALITFGDDVSTVLDFTADRDGLARAAAALAPRARSTQLHTAIERAIALGRRRDDGLPARRVAIVLSDGHDEGSGLTADDVAARLREDRLPIYAIGFSRLRGEARARGFETLRRFARNSGGLFRDASSAAVLPAIYQAMRRAVTRVFTLDLRCAECPADGGLHRLEVQVKTASRVLSDGIDLRLPAAGASTSTRADGAASSGVAASGVAASGVAASGAAASGSGSSGVGSSRAAPGDTPGAQRQRAEDERGRLIARERDRERRSARTYWIGGALAAVLAVAIGLVAMFIARRRRRRGTSASGSASAGETAAGVGTGGAGDAGKSGEVGAAGGANGALRLGAREIAVTCHFLGRHTRPPVTVALRDRLIVGADPACGLVVTGDREVAAAHCELASEQGRVTLRRLDPAQATLVNGASVHPSSSYRLESGDVLLVGRTELRVIFDEGLP